MPIREKNTWANQMIKLVEAVRLLSRHNGASIDELATELEMKKRTVYRLKTALERMIGSTLNELDGLFQTEKRFKFPDGFTLQIPIINDLGLETSELIALYALRLNAGLFKGSVISSDIDKAFTKIGRTLSPAAREMLENYVNLFISVPKTPKDYSEHAEIIEELSIAILENFTCTICYTTYSGEEITEKCYNINPLHFFERDGGLYIFAVVSHYGTVRLLAVERIKSIEVTDQHFARPKDFDPAVLLEKAFGVYWDDPITAKIRFTKSQARYIRERKWAEHQFIEEQTDGSIILTMDTSGRYDIKRWVMSIGADAELLEPTDLREEIRDEIKAMGKAYKN